MPVKRETRTTRKPKAAEPELLPLEGPGEEESATAFDEVAERVRAREASPVKRAAAERHEKEVMEATATTTVEGVVRSIAELRLGVNGALDTLSSSLVEQAKSLQQLEEAERLRRQRIAELSDVQVAADTLADLVARHESEREEFERQQAAERAAWQANRERVARELEEEKALQRKQWEREEEEYAYDRKVKRSREEAEYQAKRQAMTAAFAEEKARAEAELAAREQAVSAREGELAELKSRVDGFSKELEAAVTREVARARAEVEEKARVDAALRAKDVEGAEKLLKLQVANLEKMLKEQTGRIDELQAELKAANEKAQALALKIVEGAASVAALSRSAEAAAAKARQEG
jgi:chromosome segregation ATPase